MQSQKHALKRNAKTAFQTTLGVILLFLYVLGSNQTQSIHGLFHIQENAELHSPKNEKDPCHLVIYHHLKESGCHHNTHLVSLRKCPLCDLSFHSEHIPVLRAVIIAPPAENVFIEAFIPLSPTVLPVHRPSRAPPVA